MKAFAGICYDAKNKGLIITSNREKTRTATGKYEEFFMSLISYFVLNLQELLSLLYHCL